MNSIRLNRLFEDDRILAIDKPSGLPSHSLRETDVSCESILKQQIKESDPKLDLFLLHRLDSGTSGVLLFAKDQSTFNEMRELFKLRNIKKQYFAWTEKTEARASLVNELSFPYQLNWPLAHHPNSKKRMIALPPEKFRAFRGKPIDAVTILHGAHEENFQGVHALCFNVEIVTGVMHQIRVHLLALGFPLIGDAVYERVERTVPVRLGLHAREVKFRLHGKEYRVVSEWRRN